MVQHHVADNLRGVQSHWWHRRLYGENAAIDGVEIKRSILLL